MSQMTMTTNHGPIVFELFDDDAPKTVDNFRKLSTDGFYDGLEFHRIIKDVTTEAAPWLDGKHTVFGRVTSGMEVVDALEGLPTDGRDRPQEPAAIEKVEFEG